MKSFAFNFVKQFNKSLYISGFIAVFSVVYAVFMGFNLGIDFTSGVSGGIEISSQNVPKIQSYIKEFSSSTSSYQDGVIVFRIPIESVEEGNKIVTEIKLQSEELSGKVREIDFVSPKIGREAVSNSLLAVSVAIVLIFIYLAFRLEVAFAVAAVVALVHDILITFGFVSLFRVEFDVASVAAILTVIGYSVNDTVIIFERIVHNIKHSKGNKDYKSLFNTSINQTLKRTFITSLTTVTVLGCISFLIPEVLNFALIALFGTFIGTYSSVFIASSVAYKILSKRDIKGGTAK